MKEGLVALVVGLLFGLGLVIAGMTQPQKVIGFLDVFGNWDPSLMFVMIGAIAVHFVAYRFVRHRTSPLLADTFYIPDRKGIDRPLVIGAVLFGMGWGLGGYCPGPAITSLVTFNLDVILFVVAMIGGMWLQELVATMRQSAAAQNAAKADG